MSEVLFEFKSTLSFGFFGKKGGSSIVVFDDGSIVQRHFIFGQDEPAEENKIAFIPEIVVLIKRVILDHESEIKKIPGSLHNGTLDGSHDCFRFGKKEISSWTIKRTDLSKVKQRNPSYYKKYKDNMIYENMVLDIYNEIIEIINRFDIGISLRKK